MAQQLTRDQEYQAVRALAGELERTTLKTNLEAWIRASANNYDVRAHLLRDPLITDHGVTGWLLQIYNQAPSKLKELYKMLKQFVGTDAEAIARQIELSRVYYLFGAQQRLSTANVPVVRDVSSPSTTRAGTWSTWETYFERYRTSAYVSRRALIDLFKNFTNDPILAAVGITPSTDIGVWLDEHSSLAPLMHYVATKDLNRCAPIIGTPSQSDRDGFLRLAMDSVFERTPLVRLATFKIPDVEPAQRRNIFCDMLLQVDPATLLSSLDGYVDNMGYVQQYMPQEEIFNVIADENVTEIHAPMHFRRAILKLLMSKSDTCFPWLEYDDVKLIEAQARVWDANKVPVATPAHAPLDAEVEAILNSVLGGEPNLNEIKEGFRTRDINNIRRLQVYVELVNDESILTMAQRFDLIAHFKNPQ